MGHTVRTPEIDEAIVAGISQGIPLAQICRDLGIDRSIVYDWRRDDEELDRRIARARDIGFDAIADECLRIADTQQIGERVKIDADGEEEVTREDMLGHRKLQIETRLKLLAKWDPKRYGDKQLLGSDPENPLPTGFAVKLVKGDK